MKKITLIAAFLALFVGLTAAQPEVTEVNLNPSNPSIGEQVEVTAEAQGYNLDYIEAKMPGESQFESRNCGFTCDNYDDPWTFTPDSAGDYTVEVKAGQILGEESDTVSKTVSVGEERERYAEFNNFPSNWEEGESRDISAEAYDSEGKLYNQDFKIRVRQRYAGFWGSWTTVSTNDCYYPPGLRRNPSLENCDVSGEFEPSSDRQHQMEAFVRTSDDNYRLYDREYFTPDSDDPETHKLSVTIRDDSGSRLEGADVEVDGETKDTNSLGRAVFYLENGNYEVDASKEGYVSESKDLEIDGSDESLEFNLQEEEPETHSLTVTVRDENGNRLSNADVKVNGETKDTNSLGRVQFELEDGEYGLEASKSGYVSGSKDIEIDGADKSVSFNLDNEEPEEHELTVTVRDEGSSRLSNAEVEVNGESKDTNSLGRAKFYLEDGNYDVEASKNRYISDSKEVEIDGSDKSVSFNLNQQEPEEHQLTVTVRDESGSRLSNADVEVNGETKDTNFLGRVQFELENNNYDVEASKNGYVSESQDVEIDGGDESLEFQLEEQEADTHSLTVTVRDEDGSRLSNADVQVDGNTKDTNSLGRVRFYLENDKYDIEASKNGYSSNTREVEINNGDKSVGISIEKDEDPITRPDLSLSSVTASDYSIGQGQSTTLRSNIVNDGDQSTSFNMRWRAGGVELGRRYSSVSGNDDTDSTVQRSFSQLENRGLSAGNCYNLRGRLYSDSELVDTRDASQDLCLEDDDDEDPEEPGLYDFSVVVLNDRGSTLEGAEVNVGGNSAVTGSNGVVTFDDIEEGTYDVVASRTGYSTQVRNNVDINRDKTISMTLSEIDGPDADFTWSPERPLEDQEVVFDADRSSGDIEEYRWDFDDGSTGTGETIAHEFDSSGFYRVDLEVEDEDGRTDDRTRVVQVRAEDEDPEVYELDVEVLDEEDNDPIEDARVSVDGRTRETDDDGRTEFDLDEAVYDVFVSAEGYDSKTRWIAIDRDRDLTVELDREDDDDRPSRRGVRINDIRVPSSVCRGEDVVARIDVENTDDDDRAFTLSATGLGNEIDRSYSIDDEESSTKAIEFVSVEGSGNEQISFSTGYDSSERTVQVRDCNDEESANDISISATPTQVRIGDSVRVTGYVDDVERGTQVDIYTNNRYRSLGSTTTEPDGRYELYVQPERIGGKSIRAEVNDKQASTRIDVLPTVAVIDANSEPDRVFEGENYDVCAEVESQSSGPLVVLKQDGEQVDSKYGRGEVCFERRSSPGTYDYEIEGWARGQSSSKSTTVEVLEMDSEVRNFPDQIASVRSGSGMIKVELYNNQRELRDYQLEIDGVPESWISQSRKEVILDTGERSTEYFYFTPKEEGDFRPELTVDSNGQEIYSEEIRISSGGTDREPSRWDQLMMWLRYR